MSEIYKRYRPKSLDRIIGNEETVAALKNMTEKGTLPHSLLFVGPSGCGKTTLARILQDMLKCDPTDLREVNSSSYRGIDSIREIARATNLSPTGPCRVWILDEVHKLSNDAQNAALKMLEDTPAHVYFFLCTTDPEKLIAPLRNRCCEMVVRSLKYPEMEKLLDRVAKKENIKLSSEHRDEIIIAANGSARRLLVLLDKISHLSDADRTAALEAKIAEDNEAIDLCRALIGKVPWKAVSKILKGLVVEPETVRWSVLGYAKAVLLSDKPSYRAYLIILAFSEPFYDSKEAGLAAACYEVVNGEDK